MYLRAMRPIARLRAIDAIHCEVEPAGAETTTKTPKSGVAVRLSGGPALFTHTLRCSCSPAALARRGSPVVGAIVVSCKA